ncbi:hypothetical protein [Brevibacillus sp. MCWH]|uniref:hypothetical protein n=1 Tax=Brevibacillus sp. MCWH TaxID=2508871 RepID=UPI001492175A|nr:hypothetical protein [Brevibacillus sp. MCWH]NNV01168.1 hypothetical protein [Brevibacillus sp. MCWH]
MKTRKKLVSTVFLCAVMATGAVSAATSSTTLSNTQDVATGSLIYQGSGNGKLKGNLTKGSDMYSKARMVHKMWPDETIASLKLTSSAPSKSINVTLSSADNAYYVQLEQISGGAEGNGSLTN